MWTWCFPLFSLCVTERRINSTSALRGCLLCINKWTLGFSFNRHRMCLCVILEGPQTFRNASLSCRPQLSSPPSCSPSPPTSSYKAAQQPSRGAPPLIRVTNWGAGRGRDPSTPARSCDIQRGAQGQGSAYSGGLERGRRVWISLTEQTEKAARWERR